MGRAMSNFFLAPPPEALGRGQKVKYHLISKILIPNFVCVLTNERYKTHQMGFSFLLGSGPRDGTLGCWGCPGGLWGAGGAQGIKFFLFQTWSCDISIDGDDEQS